MASLLNFGAVALVCMVWISIVASVLVAHRERRKAEWRDKESRERFWKAIPGLTSMFAGTSDGRLTPGDWSRILKELYGAGFSLEEAQKLIGVSPCIFYRRNVGFNFLDFLRRKNAWSLQTFGPGNSSDRAAGIIDHILKELDEIRRDPRIVEEWIDVAFLSLDGAFRAGADAEAVAQALELKLAKNLGRKWPDWRTSEPGKAIEHDRTGE